jgi:hypothetical protein
MHSHTLAHDIQGEMLQWPRLRMLTLRTPGKRVISYPLVTYDTVVEVLHTDHLFTIMVQSLALPRGERSLGEVGVLNQGRQRKLPSHF